MTLPALFLSHGSPALVLEDCPARDFLKSVGSLVPKPEAILVVSAHWETEAPRVTTGARPQTVHDFFGFPEALYRLSYEAPGDPALAQRVIEVLRKAGFQAEGDESQGFDHGVWSPLILAFPEAEVPVLQLSLQPGKDARHHLALGRALAPLREQGVLIVGSGSATHNLSAFRQMRLELDMPPVAWAEAFADWLAAKVEAGDEAALLDWQGAPEARRNHPTQEHFLPFFVALGAGTRGTPGRVLHRSMTYGVLAMDAYAFD
jgi:4,5-DOPA dioxygenase extradiol